MAADAEICAMLADVLEEVGIPRGDYVVRVNNRKILDGILEGVLVQNEKTEALPRNFKEAMQTKLSEWDFVSRDAVLRTIDKFDKVGPDGVIELLTTGRKDQSGAFIEGVGLAEKDAIRVTRFMESRGKDNNATLSNLRNLMGSDWLDVHEEEGVYLEG